MKDNTRKVAWGISLVLFLVAFVVVFCFKHSQESTIIFLFPLTIVVDFFIIVLGEIMRASIFSKKVALNRDNDVVAARYRTMSPLKITLGVLFSVTVALLLMFILGTLLT